MWIWQIFSYRTGLFARPALPGVPCSAHDTPRRHSRRAAPDRTCMGNEQHLYLWDGFATPDMAELGGADPAGPAGVDGRHGAIPGDAEGDRTTGPIGYSAAMDPRYLRVPDGGTADHHGEPGRPNRAAHPPAGRRDGLRDGLGARGVRAECGRAHRGPGADGSGRCGAAAVEPRADLEPVHRTPRAGDRHLRLGGVRGGRVGDRPDHRRGAAVQILVGIGLPDQHPGRARLAGAGSVPAAGASGGGAGTAGSAERGAVVRRDLAAGVRGEGGRRDGHDRADGRGGCLRRDCADGVRVAAAAACRTAARPAVVSARAVPARRLDQPGGHAVRRRDGVSDQRVPAIGCRA